MWAWQTAGARLPVVSAKPVERKLATCLRLPGNQVHNVVVCDSSRRATAGGAGAAGFQQVSGQADSHADLLARFPVVTC